MTHQYIITLMSANRVGILAAVTSALDELGGDIQELSQTVMQQFFTIILAAKFPDARKPEVIVEHIQGVCRPFGVEVCLKDPTKETLQEEPPGGTERYFVTVTGDDKPGIVRTLSIKLAQEGIDITDLYAFRNEAGSFVMIMELAVPPRVDALALQQDLEELGRSVGLSATLQHGDIFAAIHNPSPVRVSRHIVKKKLER